MRIRDIARNGNHLTGLVGLLHRFRLEELLEVRLTIEHALVALVIVHVELLAALGAPEAILVPDHTLGLYLLHLEHDLAAAATVRIRVAILTHLRVSHNRRLAPSFTRQLFSLSFAPRPRGTEAVDSSRIPRASKRAPSSSLATRSLSFRTELPFRR